MSPEQLNALADITSTLYGLFICILIGMAVFSVVLYLIAWSQGYDAGRHDALTMRRPAAAHLKPYKTPKTLPSRAMPNVKLPTVYTIRRNNVYQTR